MNAKSPNNSLAVMPSAHPPLPWTHLDWGLLGFALAIALVWRLVFLWKGLPLLCGDQAVVGIMAQRILAGEFTIFYAGQHYLGQTETVLVALFFFILRMQTPLLMKLIGLLLSLAFTAVIYLLARTFFERRAGAFFAALFTAASPVYFTLWSLKLQGGFLLTLIMGCAMLILAQQTANSATDLPHSQQSFERKLLALALVMGFSLYQYLMIAPFLATTLLLLCWSPARRPLLAYVWNGEQPVWRVIIRALFFLFVFTLFCLLIIRGVNNWGLLMPRTFYASVCLGWLALGAGILLFDRTGRRCNKSLRDAERDELLFIKWLMAFSVGFSPAIVHVAFTKEVWFLGQPANLHSFLDNFLLTPILAFPSMIGDLPFSEINLVWPYFEPLSDRPPWFVTLAFALIALCFANLGYLALRPRDPALSAKERRAAALMLAHMLFAYLFYCLSRDAGVAIRHLLPLYVGLFILLGLFTQLLWRLYRPTALVYIVALMLMFGVWNFRHHNPDYLPGSYQRRDIIELADWLREQEINDIYSYDYHICHLLQMELGMAYNVTCVNRQYRFTDTRERVLNSRRFATIGPAGWMSSRANLEGLEYQQANVGPHTVYYQFQRDGRPVAFREIKVDYGEP